MRKFKTGLLTAAVISALSIASAVRAEDVMIGVPMAQSGPIAFVGVPGLKAMQLAVDEANEAKVLGPGRTIKMVVADDASDRTQAITLTNKMIQADKVLILCGLAGTNSALAAAAVANEQQTPMIAMAVSSSITTVGKYSFHVMSSPSLQVGSVMQYMMDHYHPKTVATIWGRDNDGAVLQGKFARQWLDGKATLLPEESYVVADTDFTALATKLAFANPDAVFITASSEASGANIALQLRQGGVKSVIIGATALAGPGFIKIAGKAAEGTLAPADYTVSRPDPLNKNFVAAYTKRFGAAPDNWAGLGYTAMQASIQAIKAAGPNPTRAAVRDALANIKDMPSVTGAGTFSFDKDREPAYGMAILIVKNGEWGVAP